MTAKPSLVAYKICKRSFSTTASALLRQQQSQVVIIGGGIGGLSTAVTLQRRGIPVKVFERDENQQSRSQGYAITLNPVGLKALKQIGVDVSSIRSSSLNLRSLSFYNTKGDLLMATPDASTIGEYEIVSVQRPFLRDQLLNCLEPGTVEYGAKLARFTRCPSDPRKIVAIFEDGREEECSLLVAADGTRSVVRKQLIGDSRNYLGMMSIGGRARNFGSQRLDNNKAFMTLSREGAAIFAIPYNSSGDNNDTYIAWSLTFKCPDEADWTQFESEEDKIARARDFVMQKVAHWHDPVPDLVRTTFERLAQGGGGGGEEDSSSPAFSIRKFYDHEPQNLRKFVKEQQRLFNASSGRDRLLDVQPVVILGDAAHSMSPFQGKGGNSAIKDAAELAEALTRHRVFTECGATAGNGNGNGNTEQEPDPIALRRAVLEFYSEMEKRSAHLVHASRTSANVLVTDSRIVGALRDQGLRIANWLIQMAEKARSAMQMQKNAAQAQQKTKPSD